MNFGEDERNEHWCCSYEPCLGLVPELPLPMLPNTTGFLLVGLYGDENEPPVFTEGANCSAGTVLHLRQPCHGKCNDYKGGLTDRYRNYIPCSHLNHKNNISQCIRAADKNDNLFTCLNRADENPFLLTNVHETTLDALDLDELLTSCTTARNGPHGGLPGLSCPSVFLNFDNTSCLPFVYWCHGIPRNDSMPVISHYTLHYCKFKNNEFHSSDVRVCSNETFWQQHPCGDPNYRRCSGTNPGKCQHVNESCPTSSELLDVPYLSATKEVINLVIKGLGTRV